MEWTVDLIDVPRDGSCFFSSIAISMNESLDLWQENDFLREKMEKYWEEYVREEQVTIVKVTSHLVRYICAVNLNEDIFETYCVEAIDRANDNEKHVRKFRDMREMAHNVRNGNFWGDHSMIRTFFNAFKTKCSLIIFDVNFGGIVYFQKDWTKNKDMYICLQRDGDHYRAMRLSKNGNRLRMCMSREDVLDFVNTTNEQIENKIINIY